MPIPSLSSGCEIAPFFARHTAGSPIVASKNGAMLGPLLNEESEHTWVLELGQSFTNYFESFWFGKWNFCSPNEDFGRPTEHSGTYFQSTFQRNVAQIEYSPFWKVLWKYVPECSSSLPKSSFGEHRMTNYISHIDQSNRCAIWILWFSGQELQTKYRTSIDQSARIDVRYASCDFLAKNLCSPNEDFGKFD